jgi:hypothetical protein
MPEFRSSDTTHRPATGAPELTGRYAAAGNLSYYPPGIFENGQSGGGVVQLVPEDRLSVPPPCGAWFRT